MLDALTITESNEERNELGGDGFTIDFLQEHRASSSGGSAKTTWLRSRVELVLCCDLVVAASTAAFGLPEVKRGLMPDFGGAFRSARMLPPNVARELLLTGDNLPAERAERLGFVNLVTEPGGALAGALALAERICANAPLATREALGVVNHVVAGDEDELWKRSDAAHERLLGSADVREGIAAFFERRQPNWQAR